MSTHRRLASLLLVVVALAGPACDRGGDDADTATGAEDEVSAGDATTTTAASQVDPQDAATAIAMTDFAFEPARVEVERRGVAIKLTNKGKANHTFTIDKPQIDHEVGPGRDNEVLAALPDAGEVVFYCRFHRGQGMEGTLVVKG